MAKIKEYFTSDSLWVQIIATLIAAAIIGIVSILSGMLRGLSLSDAVVWLMDILNTEVSLYWMIIILVILIFSLIQLYKKILRHVTSIVYSKDDIDNKINVLRGEVKGKLDASTFERFSNVYDYRRLKNHPLNEMYSINDVESFIEMIQDGNRRKDIYKLEYGMAGLAMELKEVGWIHSANKNKVMDEIENCFTDKFIHEKEDLQKVLNTIKVN